MGAKLYSRWNYLLCSAFGLTFALPPFFQQTVLCRLQRHTRLALDRSNRHLICRQHREHEECAVNDIGELTECSLSSGREVANMGFHVTIISHAQGSNEPQCLGKRNIACRTKSVMQNSPDPRRMILIFQIRHQSPRNGGKEDRIGLCRPRFSCVELYLVLRLVLLTRCGF